MRYCGNCGAPLDDRAIANRRCANCGAEIHASGDIPFAGDGGTGELTTPVMGTGTRPSYNQPRASSPYHAPPLWQVAPPPPPPTEHRQGLPTVLAFVGGIATALIVITLLVAYLARHPGAQSTNGLIGPTATARAGQPTVAPGKTATIVPTASATPQPTQPSTVPQPALGVSKTNFSFGVCFNRSINFDVMNTGSGQMTFSITNNTPYQVDPLNGMVQGGDHQQINVTKMTGVGTSTLVVHAPGARNEPITVTIHCGP
jgi:hypothetical protein